MLRALSKAHTDAWAAVHATKGGLVDAVESVLLGAFGDRRGANRGERSWVVRGAWAGVEFDRSVGAWLAEASVLHHPSYVHADTPRASVDQALAALRLTHPAEADALAAVVPKEPTP